MAHETNLVGSKKIKLENIRAVSQWLMPIILATQEAEIRRIMAQSQLEQIVLKTLSQRMHHKKGLVYSSGYRP
jgi:hypothetical protein